MAVCTGGCRGGCLHQVVHVPSDDDTAALCDFVCQFISVQCPDAKACVPAPCANFPLCGVRSPQWMLDQSGGICEYPCDMMYGRVFVFSRFSTGDACPLCYEQDRIAVEYPCGHKVCAKCYSNTVFNDAVVQLMKRCPMCRVAGIPLGPMRSGRAASCLGPSMVDCE